MLMPGPSRKSRAVVDTTALSATSQRTTRFGATLRTSSLPRGARMGPTRSFVAARLQEQSQAALGPGSSSSPTLYA